MLFPPRNWLSYLYSFHSRLHKASSWLLNAGLKHPITRVCQSGLCSAGRRIYCHDSRAHAVSSKVKVVKVNNDKIQAQKFTNLVYIYVQCHSRSIEIFARTVVTFRIAYTCINTKLRMCFLLRFDEGCHGFFPNLGATGLSNNHPAITHPSHTHTFLTATQGCIRRTQTVLLTSPRTSTIRIYSISPCKRSPPSATAASLPTRHPARSQQNECFTKPTARDIDHLDRKL